MSVNELYQPDNKNNLNANVYTNSINSNTVDMSGNLTVNGILNVTNTTPSLGPFDGALIIAGGLGVGLSMNVNSTVSAPVFSVGTSVNFPVGPAGSSIILNNFSTITMASGNLPISLTGPTASPVVLNCGIQKIGNAVTFTIPAFTATFNSVAFFTSSNTLNSAYRPNGNANIMGLIEDNTSFGLGLMIIDPTGTITLYVSDINGSLLPFTGGTIGLVRQLTLSWITN